MYHVGGLDETARIFLSRWAAGIAERGSSDLPLNNEYDIGTELGSFELLEVTIIEFKI